MIGVYQSKKFIGLIQFTELPFIHLASWNGAKIEITLIHFWTNWAITAYIHTFFFFLFPRETVKIVLFLLIRSGPWWFHLAKKLLRDQLPFSSRKELLSGLPSPLQVSAAGNIGNGWNAARRRGRLTQSPPHALHHRHPSLPALWLLSGAQVPDIGELKEGWEVLGGGWSKPEDCSVGTCNPGSLLVGRGRASGRQGTEANEAVIMLKTIMALLWELLKRTSQGSN